MILEILTAAPRPSARATLHALRGRLQVQEAPGARFEQAVERACQSNQGHERALRVLLPVVTGCFTIDVLDRRSEVTREACARIDDETAPIESSVLFSSGASLDEYVVLVPILAREIVLWQKSDNLYDGLIAALYDEYWDHEDLTHIASSIRDWILAARPDLGEIIRDERPSPFYAAMTSARDWHVGFHRGGRSEVPIAAPRQETILHRWDDGWHVVLLDTRTALHEEGGQMEHCVSTYERTLRDPDVRILSLRHPDGTPILTVEQQKRHCVRYQDEHGAAVVPVQGALEAEHIRKVWLDRQARGRRNMLPIGRHERQIRRLLSCVDIDQGLVQLVGAGSQRPYRLWSQDGGTCLPLPVMAAIASGPRNKKPQWLQFAAEERLMTLLGMRGVFDVPCHHLQKLTGMPFVCVVSPVTTRGFAAVSPGDLPVEQRAIQEMFDGIVEIERQQSRLYWILAISFEVLDIAVPGPADILFVERPLEKPRIVIKATWGPLVFERVEANCMTTIQHMLLPRPLDPERAREQTTFTMLMEGLNTRLNPSGRIWPHQSFVQDIEIDGHHGAARIFASGSNSAWRHGQEFVPTDTEVLAFFPRAQIERTLSGANERQLSATTRMALDLLHQRLVADPREGNDDVLGRLERTFISREAVPSEDISFYERLMEEIWNDLLVGLNP